MVGALILVALGVVFWPIIFVQPGESDIEKQRVIPPAPNVSVAPVPAPDQAGLRRSKEIAAVREEPAATVPDEVQVTPAAAPPEKAAPVAKPVTTKSSTRSKAPEPLAMDKDGVPIAWILQVVSVSSAEKAEELRGHLLKIDQKAYVTKVPGHSKTLYRVYIGPKFERAKLEKLKPEIDARFGVKSLIKRYVP